MPELAIPKKFYDAMVSHCKSAYPYEACGLLSGKGGIDRIYPTRNIERSEVSYMMDPAEQFRAVREMRADGSRMLAIYHSHTNSRAYPSRKDLDLAFYSDSVYIIVSLISIDYPEVRAFRIAEREVVEIEIVLEP